MTTMYVTVTKLDQTANSANYTYIHMYVRMRMYIKYL